MGLPRRTVKLKGKPVTLVGKRIEPGDKAPNFVALDLDLSLVPFSMFRGKSRIISSVLSLDTSVCDAQTRRFNEEAARLSDQVQILAVSMDLPFAQRRWCGAAGIKNITVLSDHRDASFGTAYGVLIKEFRLLARAVFIIDAEGIVRHTEIVDEITSEPDYDQALAVVGNLAQE